MGSISKPCEVNGSDVSVIHLCLLDDRWDVKGWLAEIVLLFNLNKTSAPGPFIFSWSLLFYFTAATLSFDSSSDLPGRLPPWVLCIHRFLCTEVSFSAYPHGSSLDLSLNVFSVTRMLIILFISAVLHSDSFILILFSPPWLLFLIKYSIAYFVCFIALIKIEAVWG